MNLPALTKLDEYSELVRRAVIAYELATTEEARFRSWQMVRKAMDREQEAIKEVCTNYKRISFILTSLQVSNHEISDITK